jgi:salicylate hydroxylase
VDGYNRENDDPSDTSEKLLFTLYTGHRGFAGAHRGHLMQELTKLLPDDRVKFGKRLLSYEERGDGSKVLLKFADDSTAEADAGEFLPTLPHRMPTSIC